MTDGIVYATGQGRMCPACGKPETGCICRELRRREVSAGGRLRVLLDTKGRKGRGVTLVEGLPVNLEALEALAKELKRKLGTGGTVRERTIEIQGDHREAVIAELAARGFAPGKR